MRGDCLKKPDTYCLQNVPETYQEQINRNEKWIELREECKRTPETLGRVSYGSNGAPVVDFHDTRLKGIPLVTFAIRGHH